MPRRILVLNERDLRNPLAGGAEVHLFEIFKRLVAQGNRVDLLAASFAGAADTDCIDGIHVRRLANRYAYYGLAPLAARRFVREQGADLVVDILAKLPFLSPWFVPVPCLGIVHHLFGTTAFQQVSFPVALVTYLSEKLIPLAYRDTALIAVSPSTVEDLAARGLCPAHISVIPNGIDHALYRPPTSGKSPDPLLVWLGRVEPYKRVDLFLRALVEVRRRVPDLRAVIVGDGSALAELRALASSLGLDDCVRFAGFVAADEKVRLLQQAHALVNTSEKEGWGLTVMEGNACGTITVASDVPGLRDSVRDRVTGLLVEHGNLVALTTALTEVLTDRALREELGRAALQWASQFTWDTVTEEIRTVIDSVLADADAAHARLVSPVFAR